MEIYKMGIDLAKNVLQIHAVDRNSRVVLQKAFSPAKFKVWVANLSPCEIGFEACGGSHYWARFLRAAGHEVKMISPQFVKPFVKSNKNDRADAEAIVEAMSRPSMRFVAVKEVWQQDVLSLHRIRSRLVRNKVALMNELRGLLYEHGVIIAQGQSALLKMLSQDLSERLTPILYAAITDLREEFLEIEEHIEKVEKQIGAFFKQNDDCQRIEAIGGIGVLTATALVATIGDPKLFKNGREFAAYLGLVPKQSSSGGKEKLLGISKRGDVYMRTLLIHGGRSRLLAASRKTDRQSLWMQALEKRKGKPKTWIAIANKNARVAWALLNSKEAYKEVV